ncbi:hypothetical protein JI59_24090 (plasmid) [Novosphingobium pentaromativorans US6-1]|uniref:Na+/H+ antiporter n=1 Tax=Novosphingobium pentaromativorans US6-1 TaxID=1088721 RepID=G6EJW2_9SPHN|nr:hypothetical protein JI59_24090 [Novosphingobium pentaromativorans US6-1]EHJ58400.1 Na+/H+ antiporter [Novosphingobium pentaromativorans US6-1]
MGVIVLSLGAAAIDLPLMMRGLEMPAEPSRDAEIEAAHSAVAEATIAKIERVQHQLAEGRKDADLHVQAASRLMDLSRKRIKRELRLAARKVERAEFFRRVRRRRFGIEAARNSFATSTGRKRGLPADRRFEAPGTRGAARFGRSGKDPETQMLDEGVEVPIVMEEGQARDDAPGRDQRVDRFADGDTFCSQGPKVARCLHGNIRTIDLNELERLQQGMATIEIPVAGKALENFRKDDIADQERLVTKQDFEAVCLRRRRSAEEINPGAGIDKDHRSVRMASRSPFHSNLPRAERSWTWDWSLRRRRKPASTACFFVLRPVT